MSDADTPWPAEIRLSADKAHVTLAFDDGKSSAFSAEFLRVHSPSAEVQGHSPEQRQTVPGKRDVTITALEPVGNYAVRILFADGHDTGIFSWSYFDTLDRDRDTLWARYLDELSSFGLSRDSSSH
ncbi:MAG: DUF971 domain-containing protein [Pseudomonadota bacterium]